MKCIVLEERNISGYADAKDLLGKVEAEELFVIDLDGLNRGAYNLKLYSQISKFFEITVMNFPSRTADVVDSIVSGASRVVVSSKLPEKTIRDFLAVTEDLVMNYANIGGCRLFSDNGGKYFLSSRVVDLAFEKVYLYGGKADMKDYVWLDGFPEFLSTDT